MPRTTQIATGIPGLNRALKQLAPEASKQLRLASVEIAAEVARDARNRARRVGGVAVHVADSIEATRDRVPVVKLGSTRKLPSSGRNRTGSGQTIGNVIWGAEFGGQGRPRTMQFRRHLGKTGYFVWPAVRAHSDETQQMYSDALNRALGRL